MWGDSLKRQILNSVSPLLRDYLTYSETIKGKSTQTVEQYYLDLTLFFKYLKLQRSLVAEDVEFSEIKTDDVDIELLKTVTITDLYAFIVYCKNERGNKAASRSRKVSALRMFF